ncbi:MAG: site-specific DNA-methyltransferase [Chloroflexota bacterium]|nr:site-specific DNA-methyltransferase [Chloroflexota bacterium]
MTLATGLREVRTPKLDGTRTSPWYDYYAGYSVGFVEDVISVLGAERSSGMILDPWSGSGTTPAVASRLGFSAVGLDLNPALVVIAKGRHLSRGVSASLDPLAVEIIDVASQLAREHRGAHEEPLSMWFKSGTATALRSLERGIHRVLVDNTSRRMRTVDADALSTLASFYYTALFGVVRQLTVKFRTSNPTWVKRFVPESEKVLLRRTEVWKAFRARVASLSSNLTLADDHPTADVRVGAAEEPKLPGSTRPFLILGSPPYCTRIDYVISSLPELAVLGFDSAQVSKLRTAMLGTPTMHSSKPSAETHWGQTALRFLEVVRKHPSKASASYYWRYFAQYFDGLSRSIAGLSKIMQPDGYLALVVQDSFYKEQRLDLARVVAEMGEGFARSTIQVDYSPTRTKASMHPGARRYRSTFDATESLVVFAA